MSEPQPRICFGVVKDGKIVIVGGELPPDETKVSVRELGFKTPRPFLDASGNPITLSPDEYAELVAMSLAADAERLSASEPVSEKTST